VPDTLLVSTPQASQFYINQCSGVKMADVDQRFFCHQCSVEIPRIAADFTCPTCNSGFIEELGQAQPPPPPLTDDDDDDEPYDLGQVLGPLEALLPGLLGGGARGFGGGIPRGAGLGGPMRPRQHRIRIARGAPARPGGPQNLGMDQAALENALQDFIVNLAGMGGAGGAGAGGAQFHFIGPGAGGPLGAGGGGGFHLHGNPGDYAWGRGGLDAIITQLLNHMDGAGPPPMAKESIQEIPTVNISKEQMEKSQSCSVCWEDFTEGEEVKLLECEHCFHSPCIVPWLELHGTCPVCRKELGKNGQSSPGSEGGPTEPGEAVAAAAEPVAGGVGSSTSSADSVTVSAPTPGAAGTTSTTQSVTVSGTGGLTGLIQSALNQVFNAPWSSQPNPGPSNTSSEPEIPVSSSSSNTTSSQPGEVGGGRVGGGRGGGGSQSSTSDDDTPATRRQRLDSEFVDLDCD